MYDTCLIDTNTVAHALYHRYQFSQHMKPIEFIRLAVQTYNAAPWTVGIKSIIWCGDWGPYWRKQLNEGYKANRPEKEADKKEFLSLVNKVAMPIKYPGFEADDIIANYVRHRADTKIEKVLILTVDTDLLQLLSPNCDWRGVVHHQPLLRSTSDGSFKSWMSGKALKMAKIRNLDLNDPQSVVEMKVLYGDASDNIPKGEASRKWIDLRQDYPGWVLADRYPDWFSNCEHRRILVKDSIEHKQQQSYKFQKIAHTGLPTV